MNSQWREKKLYPLLGTIFTLSVLYLNFNGHFHFHFPTITIFWPRLPKMGFVGTNSTTFFVNGSEGRRVVYVNGWNSYWLMQESMWRESRWKVDEMMKKGAEMGLTVNRTWAFCVGVDVGANSLQLSPGVFNERVFQAWIKEMAAFVKTLDSNHLVTVGLEGFYGPKTTERSMVNPGEWAASLGADFIQISAIDDIDIASVHAYPHSWIPLADLEAKIKYLSRSMDAHINDGEALLKKPVLFTEVGSPLRIEKQGVYERDVVLQNVYNKIFESEKKKEAGAGALVWQLTVEGMENCSDQFSFIAWENPSTYKIIVEQ